MKYHFFLQASLLALLLSCNQNERHSIELTAFTAPISIVYYGPELDTGSLDTIKNWLAELDQRLSRQNEVSEINRINRLASESPQVVSKMYEDALLRSLALSKASEGLFDPSLGPVISLWGIGTDKARVPDSKALEELRPLVNYKNIVYKDKTVFFKTPHMELDFGGIGKGYAADWIADFLASKGLNSAMINVGRSSIRLVGSKPEKQSWVIGLQDPIAVLEQSLDGESSLLGKLSLSNLIISTSGVYERFFEADGKFYHHIIDPKTLAPSESGVLQATVISDEATDLPDGFSTACLVGGVTRAFEIAKQFKNLGLVLVTKDKTVHINGTAKKYFELLNSDYKVKEY